MSRVRLRPRLLESVESAVSLGVRKQLPEARRIAGHLLDSLRDCCERIELAGSVARRERLVGDLDIVAIPKRELRDSPGQVDLFAGPAERATNLLYERVKELSAELLRSDRQRLYPVSTVGRLPDYDDPEVYQPWYDQPAKYSESKLWRLWLTRPAMAVEIHLCTPETWGCQMAVRTGPAELSRALVTRWIKVSGGGHQQDNRLMLPNGDVLKTPEEGNVFEAVGWEWQPAHKRRGVWGMRGCKRRWVVEADDGNTVLSFRGRRLI